MYIIIKIAKNELRNLFYSPIAWFLAIIMAVMCAFYYTGIMYPLAKTADMIYRNNPNFIFWATESLTETVYMNPQSGFFVSLMQHLYLFVPLLTMGIVNKEFNSGTIRLLYSSPIKLRNIVLGKYLAIVVYNLLLVAFIGIFIVSGFFGIKSLDYPPLLTAAFGIFLFLCALTAIGFFMSSLTNYQVVAAIASFTLLFILSRIGSLWQEHDFVRDLTYFLSIAGRTEKMLVGLIRTKDIMYYLVIIYMFVSFTLLKLRAGRESGPWYVKMSRYIAVIVSGLLIGYASSRPQLTGYLDATARKTNTIHPRTQQTIKQLNDGPLEVTLYTNILSGAAPAGFPKSRNAYISNMWENYQRFKTDIDLKYEYYYAAQEGVDWQKKYPGKTLQQVVGLEAKLAKVDSALFKSPEEISKIIDLEPESYSTVMQLKYKGRTTFLRMSFIDGLWPDEQIVNAALKRLLRAHIPKVYFVSGQLERSIHKRGEREFFGHTINKRKREALINIGFDVDTINLSKQDIPDSASIVVIADPRTNFDTAALSKLQNYVDNGGNMLIYAEPGKQSVLNPLLREAGILLKSGQLVQQNANETPDRTGTYITRTGLNLAEEYWLLKFKHLWSHEILTDSLKLSLAGSTCISYPEDTSFTARPILLTSPGKAWLKAGRLVIDSTAPTFSPGEGDIKEKSFPVAIQMSRQINNKEQRIIISGDADFASNLRLIDDFTRSLYSWLVYSEFPVYTPIPYAKDNQITLSPTGAAAQKIAYIWVLPALVLLTGMVLLVRRRRK